MGSNVTSLPGVEKISGLIDALARHAVKTAHDQWAETMSSVYVPPRLRCWDEQTLLQLSGDQEIVEYLLSDSSGAWVLMRSLHFCFLWYGQAEIDRLQRMSRNDVT